MTVALKFEIAKLDDVPEGIRNEYAEHTAADGTKSFRLALDLPADHSIENVKGLKTALAKERDNAKTAATAQEAAQRELTTLREQLRGLDVSTLKAERDTLAKTITESQQRLDTAIASAAIVSALAEHRGNATVLTPLLERQVRVVNGEPVVVGTDGKPRAGVSVSDLVGELRNDSAYAGVFAGTGKSGGGATGGDGAPGGTKPGTHKRRSQMTLAEKAAAMRELGTDGFMNLPA
jgi:hypothetical protein